MPDQIDIYQLRLLPFGFWFIEWYTGGIQCFGRGKKKGERVARLMNVEHWNQVMEDMDEANNDPLWQCNA